MYDPLFRPKNNKETIYNGEDASVVTGPSSNAFNKYLEEVKGKSDIFSELTSFTNPDYSIRAFLKHHQKKIKKSFQNWKDKGTEKLNTYKEKLSDLLNCITHHKDSEKLDKIISLLERFDKHNQNEMIDHLSDAIQSFSWPHKK